MTDSLAHRLMRDLLGPPIVASAELVVEEGPAQGQRLSLPGLGSRVVLGRGEEAGWIVLDPDLSRTHAAIEHRADGVWLIDLGSKNGTRVDGMIAPRAAPGLAVRDGARIILGKSTIRYRDPMTAVVGALTRTNTAAEVAAVRVPPRWPIVLAALVAIAALLVLVGLLAG